MKLKYNNTTRMFNADITHQEMILIIEALNYYVRPEVEDLNHNLYDCDEFKDSDEADNAITKLWAGLREECSEIGVY